MLGVIQGHTTHQRLSLELGHTAVEDEDRFDLVEEELAEAVEEDVQVRVVDDVTIRVAHAFHRLVQPHADVCVETEIKRHSRSKLEMRHKPTS